MKRGRVHLIGVAGVAMAGVARLARELSWKVTGSDRAAWPPASERLARLGVDVRPFSEANLDPAPDYVVVGNAISRGHPELERALDEGLAILSMPEFLARFVLPGRKVAAICGTHGKTTTTAMLAWILDKAGMQPGFLIGGLPEGFEDGARLGRGEPFVIEGDEYDSAFFDKRSKFVHYRPQVAVLLNLEYDHADIFPDLEAIRAQFHQMIRTIPRNGLIVAAANEEIEKTLALGCWTPVRRFGQNAGDWRYTPLEADGSRFAIHAPDGATHTIQWSQIGAHLAANACAAIAAACEGFGVPFADACQAIAAWPGVRRRMTLLAEAQG
ncbi:MAG: UDP-N-acetylmuramate:L-alanyl-gamma-D-glutamyl-meso-diaminopimelate ligase, partial [Zetaproteobacteria bacterium]